MKLLISLLAILLLAGCQPKEKKLDTDFEGSISYRLENVNTDGLDSAEAESFLSYLPDDTMIVYFDEGRFINFNDGGLMEFAYFDPHENIEYNKLRETDSLFVFSAAQKRPWETDILDVLQENNTDTILGYACNRLTMKFRDQTRTFLYSPEIATNPEWYKQTKSNHYDVLYKSMKAYYLFMKIEYKTHTFSFRAIRINPGKVPAGIFPRVQDFPKKKVL